MKYEIKIHLDFFFYTIQMTQLHTSFNRNFKNL